MTQLFCSSILSRDKRIGLAAAIVLGKLEISRPVFLDGLHVTAAILDGVFFVEIFLGFSYLREVGAR